MSNQDYPGEQDAQYVDECRYWKAKADEAEAVLAAEREELAQLREVVGVRGDVKSFSSDRDHWCRLMDKADKADRLEQELDAEREAHARTREGYEGAKRLYEQVCERLDLIVAATKGEATRHD